MLDVIVAHVIHCWKCIMSAMHSWHVLVVDDDDQVLRLSEVLLGRIRVDGHPLHVDVCCSAAEARQLLDKNTYALIIIDVVMESEHAGLDLVRDIRNSPQHLLTQLVIRTGQPGVYPEAKVLQDFRISDYWRKDDLQPYRIRASVTGLIRSYETALALEERLNERTVLLREIHHRVNNTLQLVIGILNLQRNRFAEQNHRVIFDESVLRIRAISLIHDHLYQSQLLHQIDISNYILHLSSALRTVLAPSAKMRINAVPVLLSIEAAIPMALIVNELLSNALKYGLAEDDVGRARLGADVLIEISEDAGCVRLVIEDSGKGLPEEIQLSNPQTLGFQVLRSLMKQVRAKIEVFRGRGTRFELFLPL